ncbi:unnamed protein product [Discula destructiva]
MLSSAGHHFQPLAPNSSPWAHKYNPNQQIPQAQAQAQAHADSHSHSQQAYPAQQQQQQLPKPSPLSSADNAPRSTHINAVQAVHTYYTVPSAYTHTQASNSNSTSTSSLGTFSSPPQQQPSPQSQHKLRRIPGGANLAEYRPPPPPPPPAASQHQQQSAAPHSTSHHHARARTHSLSIPSTSTMSVNGAASSPQTARGMPSINAIAAGPGPADTAGPGRAGFDGPRSPPNTSHVPCKFFRQGACQAGAACPFGHDLGAASETVCKYFAKGNCKFGPKCANIHILPTGHRVTYGKNGVSISPGLNFGNRVNPMAYGHSSNSALTNSFMRAEAVPPYTSYANATDDRYNQGLGRQGSLENGTPKMDTQYSGPTSPYGSPHAGDEARMGFGLSPVSAAKGLSVLDAPLPASFDSNGISLAARYGPWPASVPNKFGIESPTPSLSNAKDTRTSETLKMLHTSAFGSNEHLSPSQLGGDAEDMGASPPQQPIGEEFFPRRQMHSNSTRYAKPRLLSSSAPKVDRDWDDNFLFLEEDYVPSELASELLTPQEKARRGSVRMSDGNEQTTSSENSTKYGSPMGAASPSRWGPPFHRQQAEDGALGKSLKGANAFGHVGSPLRNSSLASGIHMVSSQNGGSSRPSLAGSRTASGVGIGGTESSASLSALTQQIQRTRINDDNTHHSLSSSPHLHPSVAAMGGRKPTTDAARLERHISTGSMGSNGRFTTPIDEEDPDFVFNMEEDEEAIREKSRKAGGGLASLGGGGGGGGWSIAGVARRAEGKGDAAVETR